MEAEQSRAPYYIKFHIGDYIRDCEELSLMQHGAYLRLMLWYYSTGKPIPNQPDRIYRRVHATSAEERSAVDFVLCEFFKLEGLNWVHKRIEQELTDWNAFSTAQSERRKKANKINVSISTSVKPALNQRSTNQNQNHITTKSQVPDQPWFKSNDGIASKAKELNMKPNSGESYSQLCSRIFQHLKAKA